MSLDPTTEHDRVREKYPRMRPSHVALYVLAVALLAIVSLAGQVDWSFFAGVIAAPHGT